MGDRGMPPMDIGSIGALDRSKMDLEDYVRSLGPRAIRRGTTSDWEPWCRALTRLIRLYPEIFRYIEDDFWQAIYQKSIQELEPWPKFFTLKRNNFYEPLEMVISIEEAIEHIEMRCYDRKHGPIWLKSNLNAASSKQLYQCCVDGLSGGRPSLVFRDYVILDDGDKMSQLFRIDSMKGDLMIFKSKQNGLIKSGYMSFVKSGFIADRLISTLKVVNRSPRLKDIIFPEKMTKLINRPADLVPKAKIDFEGTNSDELEQRLEKCNRRQRQAIVNILEAKCRPNAYILYGPPGTGKTFTLIETVVQIYKRDQAAKILVCSSSNTCVDFIADLLADTDEIYSLARLISEDKIRDVESRPKYFFTSLAEAKLKRVIVTTNFSASKFKAKQFDYVIVDEAGHSHIPETLIPLITLKEDGCFVLAGDPKQLGPVIRCHEIAGKRVGDSLLVFLYNLGIYSKQQNGLYNERYITKLIDSYRCDPRILGLCSELFYDGELNCLGKTPPELLKALELKKPLVFAPVLGHEGSLTMSRFNLEQAEKCLNYLFKLYHLGLRPDQIGIITPYKLQANLLNVMLKKRIKRDKAMLNELLESNKLFKYNAGDRTDQQHEAADKENVNPSASSSSSKSASSSQAQVVAKLNRKRSGRKRRPKLWIREFNWHCKIDTVDAFQGNEREIILISTVRTPIETEKIKAKFLEDPRRFNVAISRAKWLVVVFGHMAVLKCGKCWKKYDNWSARTIV